MTKRSQVEIAALFEPGERELVQELLETMGVEEIAAAWTRGIAVRELWMVTDVALIRLWMPEATDKHPANAVLQTFPWSLVRNPALTMDATRLSHGWQLNASLTLEYPGLESGTVTNLVGVRELAAFACELSLQARGR